MARSPSPRRGRYRHGLVSDTGPCLGRSWLNRSGDSLGGVDEAGAEVSAQRVPRLDAIPRFGKELVGVHLKLLLLLLHPALHLPQRHLRRELDAPRVLTQPLQEEILVAQPGMTSVLACVHCAPEDERGAIRVERA